MKKQKYRKRFYSAYKDESISSAQVVIDVLLRCMPKPLSVIDIGCGIGTWLKVWQDLGVEIQGIDGDYVNFSQMLISPNEFTPMNLSYPVSMGKIFDLAESLEVGEHLPSDRADAFIEFLCSLSSVVLFGAAIPYQGGTDHVNEQWPKYWADKFQKNGFVCVDIIRNSVWDDEKCAYYYAQNTFLYVKHDVLDRYLLLKEAAACTSLKSLARVHPRKWLEVQEGVMNIEVLFKKLPLSLYDSFVRLVKKINSRLLEK